MVVDLFWCGGVDPSEVVPAKGTLIPKLVLASCYSKELKRLEIPQIRLKILLI